MSDDPRIAAIEEVLDSIPKELIHRRQTALEIIVATDAVDPLRAPVVPPTEPTARGALAELVRLHDGPRDAAYERDKPTAWATARALVAPTEPDERKG